MNEIWIADRAIQAYSENNKESSNIQFSLLLSLRSEFSASQLMLF